MANNSFLKNLSKIVDKTPIETFSFPSTKPVWRGGVSKVGENLYKITNLQSSKANLLDREVILKNGDVVREVTLLAPENKGAVGSEFRFNDESDSLSGTFEVYTIVELKLYKRSNWNALTQTRYEEVLAALDLLNWKMNPKGELGKLFDTNAYFTQYWEEVELNHLEQLQNPDFTPDIEIPVLNSQGEFLTTELIHQEVEDCRAIEKCLKEAKELAVKRSWASPISRSMYLIEMTKIYTLFIKALLGVEPGDKTIDSLSSEEIQAHWVEIKQLVEAADADEPIEEIEEVEANPDEELAEKNIDIPGSEDMKSSIESIDISKNLSEPEELPSTISATSTST
jgi:hypothetical protein